MLQGEPGADKLRDLQPDAVVNAVNAAEALAKLVSRGVPAAEAQAAYDALHLETTPFDPAMVAISARYVPRKSPWETVAFLRRLAGAGPDGLRIMTLVCYSETAFHL